MWSEIRGSRAAWDFRLGHRLIPVRLQVYAKEEELCELQVKLGERDAALKAYKTENSRFADMKDKFKADIAALQQQVTPYYV